MDILLLGTLTISAAGLLNGTFVFPMKLVRDWNWENIWLLFALFGLIVLPGVVAFTTVTLVAAGPAKETVAPVTKLEPEKVTTVPPAVGPEVGLMLVMTGAGPRYLKPLGREPESPLGFVTVTLTLPTALAAGVVA